MAEVFSRNLLKIAVAQICQGLGWHAVQTTPCEILTDIVERYIRQLAQFTHRYSEQYGKTDPTIEDLGLALHDMGFSITELNTYIKEVEPIPFARAVPCFPIPKSSNFQHPVPGSKHCRERLHYIPDYLPPLVSIKGEPDTSDLAELSDISHSTSANGIHHEGTDTNLKSPKALGPNFEAPFTPPRAEKRSLQSPYDGHDSKRMRRVEDGTPQELVTVTMEANGILTPKREGKLPEACTPPPKFSEKLKQKSTSSSPLPETSKLKGTVDAKKSSSKDGSSSKKPPKENESKKSSAKSDSKKQSKDNVESKKSGSNENNDPSKGNKSSKTSAGKKSPKPSQAMSPAITTSKSKSSQKSPKPSFSVFSTESSFKYPTKQRSVGGSDKPDFGNSSKSPKPTPSSPHVLQTMKKSDLQTPTTKSQPATKKSDIYDFDDDEFDSPPKDKSDPKLSSPPSETSLNAMQEAFRSAVEKGKQEMEAGKSKQSSGGDGSAKPDSSPLTTKNPSDASYDAAISAVIKKKQKNTSLQKSKEANLPPKFAFKQAFREQAAELKKKQTTKSSNVKRPKKTKKEKAKDSLHSVKNTAIKKQKKIYKDKGKKLKIASNVLDETKETKKLPELTFKLKTSGGETKIVKDSKQDKSTKLKFAPIPKLNIKRKNSTSLQVVLVKPELDHSKKDEKRKEGKKGKSKDKLKKKKKLKLKTSQDGSGDTVKNVAKKAKSEGEPLVPKITLTFGSSSTAEGSKRFVIKPIKPPSPVKKSPSPIPQPTSPVAPIPTPVIPVAPPAKTPTAKKKKTVKAPSPLSIVPPARPITPTTTPSPTSKASPIEIKLDSKIFSPYNFDSDSSNQSLETPRTPNTSPTPLFPKPDVSPTYKPAESPPYKPAASPPYKSAVSPSYKSAVSPPYKSALSPSYKSAVSPSYKPDSPVEVKTFDLPPVKPKETKPPKKSSNQSQNKSSKSTTEKTVKKSASPATNPAPAVKGTPERKAPSGPKPKPPPKTASPTAAQDKPEPPPAPVSPPSVKTETVSLPKANKPATPSSTKAASKAKSTKAAGKATGTPKAQAKAQKVEAKAQKVEAKAQKVEAKAQKVEAKAQKVEAKAQKLEERSVVTETIGTVVAETEEKIWICPTCNLPDDGSPMIGCDNCDDWYHWPCVKILKEPPETQDWFCPKCRKKKRKRKKF